MISCNRGTAYLVDLDWLHEAYRRTRKDGAVGVDGVTAAEYEQDLEGAINRLPSDSCGDRQGAAACAFHSRNEIAVSSSGEDHVRRPTARK